MSFQIILPKIGFSMADATLAEWFAANGDHVEAGQPLYALESEKSVQEIESPATGTLRVLADAGEDYPVGHILGEIT